IKKLKIFLKLSLIKLFIKLLNKIDINKDKEEMNDIINNDLYGILIFFKEYEILINKVSIENIVIKIIISIIKIPPPIY
ncbi:MAG: hypothetical protein IJO32_00185, partial [Bacilli bacterium]|nr:hypothetical protein [Bacilli bacterium]